MSTHRLCCCGPGEQCWACSGNNATPRRISVTFDGVILTPCHNFFSPTSWAIAGALDGTYCLTQKPDEPCTYRLVLDPGPITVTQYDDYNCTGTITDTSRKLIIEQKFTASFGSIGSRTLKAWLKDPDDAIFAAHLLFLGGDVEQIDFCDESWPDIDNTRTDDSDYGGTFGAATTSRGC